MNELELKELKKKVETAENLRSQIITVRQEIAKHKKMPLAKWDTKNLPSIVTGIDDAQKAADAAFMASLNDTLTQLQERFEKL